MMAEENQNINESGENDKAEESAARLEVAQRGKHPMEALLKNAGVNTFTKAGDILEGTVLEKNGPRLFVDLGIRGMGLVYGREYYAAQEIIKDLKPGDVISVKVVEPDNEEGFVELSLKEAGEEKKWVDLKKMIEAGEVLELAVVEANRGGLILEAKGVKGFLPASQLSSKNYPRVDGGDKERIFQELQKLVGQVLKVKVLDIDPVENKLIFTEKGSDVEETGKVLAKYKVGDVVEGEVTGVVDFGAFMKFDEAGLEGLIHVSEIDWSLIEDPRDFLKVGDRVKTKIIDIQGGKVSLSLKQLKEDPWSKIAERFKKGDVVRGTVTKFNPFGAFVRLEGATRPVRNLSPEETADIGEAGKDDTASAEAKTSHFSNGIQGLLHISEFGTEAKMKEKLELGKEYDFKILLIDPREHRLSLGMPREYAGTPAADAV